ncbi:DNA repair protein rad51d, variant 2 [Balamuthia mandrillaris]
MYMDYLNRPNTTLTLTTGCSTLDELLGGGLALGQWMEVYGRAAAGKTQLCLCAALHAARAGYGVAFVDTTSSFSINRLKELYQTSMNKPKRVDEEEEEEEENELQELVRVMSNIVCFKAIDVFTLLKVLDQTPSDANHQQLTILEDTSSDRTQSASSFDAFPTSFSTTSSSSSSSSSSSASCSSSSSYSSSSSSSSPTLNTMPGATSSNNLRLIIIDSLAAVLSPLLGTQPFGNSMMQSITLKLRAMAQHYNLAILTTNYTVSGSEQEARAIKPALGERWRYAPHSQLFLEASFSSLDERVATLTKSPILECERSCSFRITASGLCNN